MKIRRFAARPAAGGPPPAARGEAPASAGKGWTAVRRFLGATRAGATSITSVAAGVMAIGGAALITDHVSLVNQRDLLKEAAAAGAMAATIEFRRFASLVDDEDGRARLHGIAERYVRLNLLENLPASDRERVAESLEIATTFDIEQGTVEVTATAPDLGKTLLSCRLMGGYCGPEDGMQEEAGAERATIITEVVLAIDTSASMHMCLEPEGNGWSAFFDCFNERKGRTKDETRMGVVKEAAQILVETLAPDPDNPNVAIGVVPWHNRVRLDETAASEWETEGWAVYPQEKYYPRPYVANNRPGPPATRTLPDRPDDDWAGCLDRRSLVGPSPPGLSAAPPADAAFPMGFYHTLGGRDGVTLNCDDVPPGVIARSGSNYYRCEDSSRWRHGQINLQNSCADTSPMLPLTSDETELSQRIGDLEAIPGGAGAGTHSALGMARHGLGAPDARTRLGLGVGQSRSSPLPDRLAPGGRAAGHRAPDRRGRHLQALRTP